MKVKVGDRYRSAAGQLYEIIDIDYKCCVTIVPLYEVLDTKIFVRGDLNYWLYEHSMENWTKENNESIDNYSSIQRIEEHLRLRNVDKDRNRGYLLPHGDHSY